MTLRFCPSVLEESAISRHSQMDLSNSQSSVPRSSCEIPVNRAPTPSHSEIHSTSHRALPLALYKSMSSNNIRPPPPTYYTGRATVQHTRQWRHPNSSTVRPIGLPYSISQQSLSSRVCCQCQCDSNRKQVCHSVLETSANIQNTQNYNLFPQTSSWCGDYVQEPLSPNIFLVVIKFSMTC